MTPAGENGYWCSCAGNLLRPGGKADVLFFDRKPACETPWTKQLWIYDLRTNKDFTLKPNPFAREDLQEFVDCCNPENRTKRKATCSETTPDGCWRSFAYDELMARDKVNLDLCWSRDESLEDSANLPSSDVLALETVEYLKAARHLPENRRLELIMTTFACVPPYVTGGSLGR